jgi:hypothetical protein
MNMRELAIQERDDPRKKSHDDCLFHYFDPDYFPAFSSWMTPEA